MAQARNVRRGESATSWAKLVRDHRVAAGLSPTALGVRLGVDRGTIYRWESGRQTPEKLDVIERFAELFRLDLDVALAAAGLRPAAERDDVVAPVPSMAFDPDVVELQRMLNDPATPPEIKAQIRATARMLRELAAQLGGSYRRGTPIVRVEQEPEIVDLSAATAPAEPQYRFPGEPDREPQDPRRLPRLPAPLLAAPPRSTLPRPARPAAEIAKLADAIEAMQPGISEDELARRLNVSAQRLREIRQGARRPGRAG